MENLIPNRHEDISNMTRLDEAHVVIEGHYDANLVADGTCGLLAGSVRSDVQASESGSTIVEDDEPTLLDYARQHGLISSHFAEHPFQSACLPSPPRSPLRDLEDPAGVLNIATVVSLKALDGHTTHEKWDIDKASAEFIGSVISLEKEDPTESIAEVDKPLKITDLKLVEPILTTDPELDLVHLKQRNTPTIRTRGMKPFKLNDEVDESIRWPAHLLRLPAEKDQQVMDDKLIVDHDTIQYIKELATPPALEGDETELDSLCPRKVCLSLLT